MREAIPETIRIGSTDYEIEPVRSLEGDKFGYYGYLHYPSLHIRYHQDLPRQRMAEVILHETIHGLWQEYELNNLTDLERNEAAKLEESYVKVLARGMLQVIRDNPHFVAWLSQSFPEPEHLERITLMDP